MSLPGNPYDAHSLAGQIDQVARLTGTSVARVYVPLVECCAFNCRAMDKAFDADWLREFLAERSIKAVTPPKSNRKNPASCDMEVYKWRHLVENFF